MLTSSSWRLGGSYGWPVSSVSFWICSKLFCVNCFRMHFAFCKAYVHALTCTIAFILYHISIVYQADVGNNIFFVFSSTTWNIHLCNYFWHCHTSDSLSGRGTESPLPARSAELIGSAPDHYWCKELIKTDHYGWAKTWPIWTTWVEKLWMIYHSQFLKSLTFHW